MGIGIYRVNATLKRGSQTQGEEYIIDGEHSFEIELTVRCEDKETILHVQNISARL